jgi:dephospho-CoA kinase
MIIAIAGQIGSGKSTLSRILASRLNAKLLAFGDYVRARARRQGLDANSRSMLQDLGQRLANDPATFVKDALSWIEYGRGDRCIIDGVRHKAVWEEITNISRRINEDAKLVFLSVTGPERERRLLARGLEIDAIATFDNHPSERDVSHYFYEAADLRLDGRQTTAELVEIIVRSLGV